MSEEIASCSWQDPRKVSFTVFGFKIFIFLLCDYFRVPFIPNRLIGDRAFGWVVAWLGSVDRTAGPIMLVFNAIHGPNAAPKSDTPFIR